MIHKDALAGLAWRRSSFSGGGGEGGANCVELARLREGGFAVRDSKNPGAGVLVITHAGIAAWLDDLRAR